MSDTFTDESGPPQVERKEAKSFSLCVCECECVCVCVCRVSTVCSPRILVKCQLRLSNAEVDSQRQHRKDTRLSDVSRNEGVEK